MNDFKQIQTDFVASLRDPENHPMVGIEPRRMNIYKELFFTNILGFLNTGFPVLASIYGENKWQQLARQFFAKHQCQSPYFIDISKEFVTFLDEEFSATEFDPCFAAELAHYEWLELDVSARKSKQKAIIWDGECDFERVSFSGLASLAGYHYPVHQITIDNQPKSPSEPIYIVVYRNSAFDVRFSVVNVVTAHLLNEIQSVNSVEVALLLEHMSDALPQLPKQQVTDTTIQSLEQLLNQQILLLPRD
ncbi:putative DNA-binding domain-containing protein [Aliiglaciecola sp. LCG003]|uniref:HvfC family RiPP maturation protein n=1 Tax=Aliiglaciecola sp. LCG003 TaxID=3053655 RepID=UPI00257440EA|nr:putative DNA-binding domain-containing protein [Aliiglaciecola sp. LCG003]WJG08011.1 putative DNA-binding domain-containing protein [Aliiglaciecola sp. LCG003]